MGCFGLALALWKVLSPTASVQPNVDFSRVTAATVEQPAVQVASPAIEAVAAEPVAPTPAGAQGQTSPAVVAAAAPASRARAHAQVEPKAEEQPETTPSGLPSSGYLPDPVPETMAVFDKRAAIISLDAAAQRAATCKPADALGATRVAVTFAPSGKVTTAVVEGPPFAGTRVGGCIAAMMREATVPAFSGAAVTVHRSF